MRKKDLNQRPSGHEPDKLPNCSIPQKYYYLVFLVPYFERACLRFFRPKKSYFPRTK